uniref:Uncharacterized protein n=2 Tax=Zea mays TaxID=4577 RepID=B7ZZD8_MAIZE|nr:unknown [Zea mays]|eukprot:NP_001146122.1 uncharacterized protein LOC100279666 [Zea mays]
MDEEEATATSTSSNASSEGSMGTASSRLSSGIDSVSDQKLSSNWNSSASEKEVVKLSSLGNASELPVLPCSCSVMDDSVTNDEAADRSGDAGAAVVGAGTTTPSASAVAFLAPPPPRFAAVAGLCFLPTPAVGVVPCCCCSCLAGSTRFLRCVCETFLISLSVRPGSLVVMADHLSSSEERAEEREVRAAAAANPSVVG